MVRRKKSNDSSFGVSLPHSKIAHKKHIAYLTYFISDLLQFMNCLFESPDQFDHDLEDPCFSFKFTRFGYICSRFVILLLTSVDFMEASLYLQ